MLTGAQCGEAEGGVRVRLAILYVVARDLTLPRVPTEGAFTGRYVSVHPRQHKIFFPLFAVLN